MAPNKNQTEKLPYIKPEAELLVLRIRENIATSRFDKIDDEFDGDDHVFD